MVSEVETLARDCVTLPEWVERDFEQEGWPRSEGHVFCFPIVQWDADSSFPVQLVHHAGGMQADGHRAAD